MRAASGAAVLLAAGLAGCAAFDIAWDAAFPPTIPGLSAESWTYLPVGSWVTDGGVEAEAIAACFAPTCAAPAAVALLSAHGADAALLSAAIDRRDVPARSSAGAAARSIRRRPRPAVTTHVGALGGGLRGYLATVARTDGSRPAAMAVAAVPGSGPPRVVVVVARDRDTAEGLARGVVAANAGR